MADDPIAELVRLEWGVRFPSGSVDPQPDEATARHFSLAFNHSRPDLPTLVVRRWLRTGKCLRPTRPI